MATEGRAEAEVPAGIPGHNRATHVYSLVFLYLGTGAPALRPAWDQDPSLRLGASSWRMNRKKYCVEPVWRPLKTDWVPLHLPEDWGYLRPSGG